MQYTEDSIEYKRMTEAPVFPLVFKLSIPTMLIMLITSIYNMADTYFVASISDSATTAVGVVYSIQSIIQAVGYGFGMGAQSLISRKLGEKKRDEAELYAVSGFIAAFIVGLLIMILGLINPGFSMKLFGSTDTALPLAVDYGRIILIGAPIFCSTFVLNNILRGEGKAVLSMIGTCSGGILNICLDAWFIRGLGMGIKGAAAATVISQCVSFSLLLIFFLTGKSAVRLNPKRASRKINDYCRIFCVGLPTVFRQSLGSIAATLLNHIVKPYGDTAFAAVSIANKIYMLLRGMLIGVGQGFQPVAGYNYGAKRYDRVRQAFNSAIIIGTVYGIIAASVLYFFSTPIMELFSVIGTTGELTSEKAEIGGQMLKYLSFSLALLGYSTFVNQLYQSLGFVVPATLLASCRQGIFFIPLIIFLSSRFGLTGIQITQSVSDILTCVVSIPFHIYFFKKILPKRDFHTQLENNENP